MKSVLIVLGGGVNKEGVMPPWIHARLEKTLEEWNEHKYDYLIATGKGRAQYGHTEAAMIARYLAGKGIPKNKILIEDKSTSTIENAYFCRVNFLDRLQLRKVTIVTNQFHINRAKATFQFILGENYAVDMASSNDVGIPDYEHTVLQEADIEQAQFLQSHIFNGLEQGNLMQIKNFIFNSENNSHKAWEKYKKESRLYRKVTELMT